MNMDLDKLREWMKAMQDFDMAELTIEENGQLLHLRREEKKGIVVSPAAALPTPVPETAAAGQAAPAAPAEAAAAPAAPDEAKLIKSPVVGVFYASSAPDKPPFVSPGDEIKEGDIVCIVEAMKLMNEVQAPIDGVVKEILVSSGQKVEYGQPLMLLE